MTSNLEAGLKAVEGVADSYPHTPSHNEVAHWLFDNYRTETMSDAFSAVSLMSERAFRNTQEIILNSAKARGQS